MAEVYHHSTNTHPLLSREVKQANHTSSVHSLPSLTAVTVRPALVLSHSTVSGCMWVGRCACLGAGVRVVGCAWLGAGVGGCEFAGADVYKTGNILHTCAPTHEQVYTYIKQTKPNRRVE